MVSLWSRSIFWCSGDTAENTKQPECRTIGAELMRRLFSWMFEVGKALSLKGVQSFSKCEASL